MATESGESTSTNCDACPAGSACKVPNSISDCAAGFYCTGSTTTPRPNSSGGTMCIPGYYCDVGSSSQTPCPAGYYCPNYAANSYF